jgi:hypothetical protein
MNPQAHIRSQPPGTRRDRFVALGALASRGAVRRVAMP